MLGLRGYILQSCQAAGGALREEEEEEEDVLWTCVLPVDFTVITAFYSFSMMEPISDYTQL